MNLPAQKCSLTALSDLADSITGDLGVNGSGTLTVTTGTGATLATQTVLDVTISSPYASTTLVTLIDSYADRSLDGYAEESIRIQSHLWPTGTWRPYGKCSK